MGLRPPLKAILTNDGVTVAGSIRSAQIIPVPHTIVTLVTISCSTTIGGVDTIPPTARATQDGQIRITQDGDIRLISV